MPISMGVEKPGRGSAAVVGPQHGDPALRPSFYRRFRKPVSSRELIFFTAQLSLMLEVGTTLSDALNAAAQQTANPEFKAVILAIVDDIRQGRQFSDALRRFPSVFDGVYMSMVKAGETGGFLKATLDRMVELQEKRQALVNELRTALAYPVVLCSLAAVVVVFILVGVLPKFTAFFVGKEHILPTSTRALMALSASLRGYWWAHLLGLMGLVAGVQVFRRSAPGRRVGDRLAISLPLISRLSNKIYTCELLRTLGHLLESRVPLLEALELTRSTMRNRYYQGLIADIAERVRQGGRFAAAFADFPHIPASVRQMVATGEESGNLHPVMLRLAEFYDKEVDQELKLFAALVEPMALIVLGAIIGVMVASIILPMFKLAHAVG